MTFVFLYLEKARLCLFGSSKNGFGFRDSDLDICMTLEGHENAEVRVYLVFGKGCGSLFSSNDESVFNFVHRIEKTVWNHSLYKYISSSSVWNVKALALSF